MSSRHPPNSIRLRRQALGWSQQALAERTGISRAGVSAIESGRLSPSVNAAITLARVLGCTVEELFSTSEPPRTRLAWVDEAPGGPCRYWCAAVEGRLMCYPLEDDSPQTDWHDGVYRGDVDVPLTRELAERTVVVACCDPAAGLLAAEVARQFQLRMIVLRRSSAAALELLAAGKVHVAGVHLRQANGRTGNSRFAREKVGGECQLVRVAQWQEGLATSAGYRDTTLERLASSKARWVGREPGSGARQCQDEVLGDRPAPRKVAFDHRSVATAVRCNWADVGPCVRLVCEESELAFRKIRETHYDLCFRSDAEGEPRLAALLATIRSRHYRAKLAELPGYSTRETGEFV